MSDGQSKTLKVKLDAGAYMPERAHSLDAGYDLRTPAGFMIRANDHYVVDTGVHMQIPAGYVGFLKSKSGLNVTQSITGEGVIDSGYTGSIRVKLYNHSTDKKFFRKGDKIIQIVLLPVFTPELEQVKELDKSERGNDGFGSTGR